MIRVIELKRTSEIKGNIYRCTEFQTFHAALKYIQDDLGLDMSSPLIIINISINKVIQIWDK
jgi:hypothetical protein